MLARSGVRLTLPIVLSLCVASILTAAPEETAVGWGWDQVTIVPTSTGGSQVRVEGATLSLHAPGEPALPAFLVEVRAPEGHRVASVAIEGEITSLRELHAPIEPVLLDAPSTAGGPTRVEPLTAAYQVPSFPEERVAYLGIGLRRGVAWARFAIHPLLLENGTRVRLLESGQLRIEWIADPAVPLPFKSLREEPDRSAGSEGIARALTGEMGAVTERPALSSAPVEYLILTNEDLAPSMEPFAEWKNHTGTATEIRTVEWVLEQYTFGADSQERIRNFLREAYRYWGTEWLLIIGGPDEVPIRSAKSYAWNNPHGVDIITDYYYACLDGTWNADGDEFFGEAKRITEPVNEGDGVDFDPELIVGRIPATSPEQLSRWLEKYFRYVQNPITDGYLDEILLLGEVLFDSGWNRGMLPTCTTFGTGCPTDRCDECIRLDGAEDCVRVVDIVDAAPDLTMTYIELYEWYEYWQENGRPDARLEDKATVVNEINDGVGLLHHVGHGDRDRMSIGTSTGTDGNGRYLVSDAREMSNGDRVGVVYSINCNSAAIDYDCLGEAMIFAENGGMVGYIGSTNLDFPSAASGYMNSFYTKVFNREYGTIGEAYSMTIAEQMASSGESESYRRFLAYSLIDLGEPQMSLWLGTPQGLAISGVPNTVRLGESTLGVDVTRGGELLAGATVCAYKEGDVYAVGTTDAAGHVDLPFRPTSQGSFRITVTEPQSIPWKEEAARLVVAPSDTPPLSITGVVVSDEAGSETAGNGNGLFEEGETVKLDVLVSNGDVGEDPITGVTLTLSIGPEEYTDFIEILDGSETGLSFNPSTTAQVFGAFRIRLASASSVPEGLYQNADRLPFVATVRIEAEGQMEEFEIALPAYRPVLDLEDGTLVEKAGTGNGDDIPEAGETMLWTPLFRNVGTGSVHDLIGYITAVSGATVLVDSASLEEGDFGDLLSSTSPFEFEVDDQYNLRLNVTIRSNLDPAIVFFDRQIDFTRPGAPSFPTDHPPGSTKDAVILSWTASTSADVQGYVLERSLQEDDAFERVNTRLIREMQYYRDDDLEGLTRYYYRAAAVDSSGNWSVYSEVASATTTPAVLAGWPFTVMGDMMWSCPTVENIDGQGSYEIFTGADRIYGLRADGSEIIDGDGISSTPGVWSASGSGFWSKPAIGDLDGDGNVEIVVTSRYAGGTSGLGQVFVWNASGELLWNKQVGQSNYFMASPVIADIDGDDEAEVICHQRGALFAWNHDGSPVIPGNNDGRLLFVGGVNESNPGSWPYTYGSPAAADVDNDGKDELILGLETNESDKHSRLVVVDGDGTLLAETTLEIPGSDGSAANSSPSLADVDDDGVYEIFVATRNYLWAFYYNAAQQTLEPEPDWPTYGRVGIGKLPTNWVEPTPAIGDVDGDGKLDVVLGTGLGKVLAVHGTDGQIILNESITSSSSKVGSAILVQMDEDPAAEIVIGDKDGVVYALDEATREQLDGFPYVASGRLQHGLNLWDVDRDGHPNLLIQAEQNPNVIVLDINNVEFPDGLSEAMARNPWTSFRHDARNSGTLDKKVITPVRLFDLAVGAEPGGARLEWTVTAEPASFRVLRQDLDGIWRSRIEAPASFFRTETGYRYVDAVEPGRYLYQVAGDDEAGREQYRSRPVAVTIQPFTFRLAGAAPNPFNPRTAIRFETPGGSLLLEIVDLVGRRVRTLAEGPILPGAHERIWDGRDEKGRPVGSGVYLVRLRGEQGSRSGKLVLLR